ncbi:MAG TPA: GNAT family N-acetyltransferase [Gaiellaceae bacterium]|nr:GNAT family N-acetyltransferase [Gaiellaceae bacterium]
MDIRPARDGEVDAIAELYARSQRRMTYLPPMPDEHIPLVAGMIGRHDELWLAEEEGRILGFVSIDHSQSDGWEVLERLFVEPDVQNRGIGTALLEQAKALRPDGLVLWLFQKNTGAIRFYERHGFRLVKLTDGAENMEHEPDALYEWRP